MFLNLPNSNQEIQLNEINKIDVVAQIHDNFLSFLKSHNETISDKLIKNQEEQIYDPAISIEAAKILEQYLTILFNLEQNQDTQIKDLELTQNIYKTFILKKCYKKSAPSDFNLDKLSTQLREVINNFSELTFVKFISNAIFNETEELLSEIEQYCLWACHSNEGKIKHQTHTIFQIPEKLNLENLINIEAKDNIFSLKNNKIRYGFDFHDHDIKTETALKEANYCLYCHNREKDSCSKGLLNKDNSFKKSASSIELKGCPLDQKISEMNLLYKEHKSIAALAMLMIDNPMLLLTGHRICNDCMKACIFQTQDPVNIPLIETTILDNVLDLNYGFEVYYLLTLWNPLNINRPKPKSETSNKILICGAGPAGISLAYNLLMDGHIAVIIDGLKIESVSDEVFDKNGDLILYQDCKTKLFQNLSEKIAEGFGGVAEYGITPRWNKNYLKLARITLERHHNFHLYGGVRFGSQITKEQAFELGFDHIAFCMGAGSPNIINLKNNLIPGVKKASDFLMTLQLLGGFDIKSLVNMQIRMPIVVIGGGLTAIDTATESLAYYPIQILKLKELLDNLITKHNLTLDQISLDFNESEKAIFNEFLDHSQLFEAEIANAKVENSKPNFLPILNKLGGALIIYRKSLKESPAYRLNHEEVIKALEEGIKIQENTTPIEIIKDKFGSAESIKTKLYNQDCNIPAKTILIAAGTKANVIIASEDQDFHVEDRYLKLISKETEIKDKFICYKNAKLEAVSVFGDMHPYYAGSVVKALASSKYGYKVISRLLTKKPLKQITNHDFKQELDISFEAKVTKITRLTDNIIEVKVRSKLACKNFQAGQFYRLQNFSKSAKIIDGKRLDIEPLALTGSEINLKTYEISLIALEMGGSSNLLKHLNENDEIILMGPTGTPTEIPKNKTILLAGGGLGNAVLFSIGKALKNNGCKVLYFAGYKKNKDRYKIEAITNAADTVIWCTDEENDIANIRQQDYKFTGNIIKAMLAYANGKLCKTHIKFEQIDRIIAIGSDKMMHAIAKARHKELAKYLDPKHDAIASINSPMNCMMKEICGQCIQRHKDPKSKNEYFVFSCKNQDQFMDNVDFDNLSERLSQNSVKEKLTKLWIKKNIK
ncbi:FAD-dependent oxidoreductase [Rickettsiales bacterium]|nr:FAD-dependent oxidoreductase [Rickettsiales bacterium]